MPTNNLWLPRLHPISLRRHGPTPIPPQPTQLPDRLPFRRHHSSLHTLRDEIDSQARVLGVFLQHLRRTASKPRFPPHQPQFPDRCLFPANRRCRVRIYDLVQHTIISRRCSRKREHRVHVMLVEQMTRSAHAHKHAAVVAVVEDGHGSVQDTPASDHVVFVCVVLDVRNTARGGREGEDRVGEVGGGGAEGVDFQFGNGGSREVSQKLVENQGDDYSALRVL